MLITAQPNPSWQLSLAHLSPSLFIIIVVVVHVYDVVIVAVDPRNLPLKVCQNRVINRRDLFVDIVVVVVFLFCCVVVVVVGPKNLPLKFGQNRANNS